MKVICDVCMWEYTESIGDPANEIIPGTKWVDFPENFVCPLCGTKKENLHVE